MGTLTFIVLFGFIIATISGSPLELFDDNDDFSKISKCEDLLTAKSNDDVDLCIATEWTSGELSSNFVCKECQEWVANARNYIGNEDLSNDDIKSLKWICDEITDKDDIEACADFVDQNVLEIRKIVQSKISESNVCFLMMFSGDESQNDKTLDSFDTFKVLSSANMNPYHNDENENVSNDAIESNDSVPVKTELACTACSFLVKKLKNIINNALHNVQRNQEIFVTKVCKKLPVFMLAPCNTFVSGMIRQTLEIFKIIKPLELCRAISFCLEIEGNNLPIARGKEPPRCMVCEFALIKLQQELKTDNSEAKIKLYMKNTCSKIPTPYSNMCISYIDEYFDIAVSVIEIIEPMTTCRKVLFCQPKCPNSSYCDEESEKSFDSTSIQNIGDNFACNFCKKIIGKVETSIHGNTKEDIRKALNETCDNMWLAKKYCQNFVDNYGESIVDMIYSKVTVDTMCHNIVLCSVPEIDSLDSDMNEDNNIENLNDVDTDNEFALDQKDCETCKTVISKIESENNSKVKKEIVTALKKSCDALEKKEKKKCKKFVKKYAKKAAELIIKGDKPDEICEKLLNCSIDDDESLESDDWEVNDDEYMDYLFAEFMGYYY